MATQTLRRSVARPPVKTGEQPAPRGARPPASESALSTPRSAGNQALSNAVFSRREPPKAAGAGPSTVASSSTAAPVPPAAKKSGFHVSDNARAQMAKDVEAIVGFLRMQILWERDERKILAIVRRWADEDAKLGPGAGTPYVDQFLRQTKMRAYSRKTARSGAPIALLFGTAAPAVWDMFADQWSLVYNDLFLELEDDRMTEFVALVGGSTEYTGPPSDKDQPENFWKTMGKKEAVGVWGILKGMGTSLAGMSDAGAWAITRGMQVAGIDVAEPASAANWLAKQYDISGDEMFGKEEWSEGEELFLGMSAAEFSTHGGELVWQLVMLGKGGGGAKWLQIVEKALGTAGNLKAVQDSANNIAAIIEGMQAKSPNHKVDVKELLQNPQFYQEVTRLVANVFGALAGGSQESKRITALLDGAPLAPMIGTLVTIATSDASSDQKRKQIGPVLMDMLKQIVSTAGAAHAATEKAAPGMEGAGGGKPAKRAPAEEMKSAPEVERTPTPKPKAHAEPKEHAEPAATPKPKAQPHKEQPAAEEQTKPAATPKKEDEPGMGKRPVGTVVTPEGFPSVLLIGVTESQFGLVVRELEQSTPAGKEIAARLKSGQLHLTLDSEAITPTAAGLALPKEIHVQWGSSVEDTVSVVIHEAVHQTDVALWKGGPRSEAEALARVHQFEYRAERKLPPYDHVEEIYRLAIAKEEQSGANPAAARETARKAMIDMMRTDPKRFGVEAAPAQPVKGPAKSPPKSKTQPPSQARTSTPATDEPVSPRKAPASVAAKEGVMEPIAPVVGPEDFSLPSIDEFSLPKAPPAKKTLGGGPTQTSATPKKPVVAYVEGEMRVVREPEVSKGRVGASTPAYQASPEGQRAAMRPVNEAEREPSSTDIERRRDVGETFAETEQAALNPEPDKFGVNRGPSVDEAQRKLQDQATPSVKEQKKAKVFESHATGLEGKALAEKQGIKVSEWNNPESHRGDFGRGIDAVGERGTKRILVEYKGETSGLADDQMSNEWVGRKIAQLAILNDPMAATLLDAARQNNLQGVVYRTRTVENEPVPTRLDRGDLTRKLPDTKISDAGLIQYNANKVQAAYQAELNRQVAQRQLVRDPITGLWKSGR